MEMFRKLYSELYGFAGRNFWLMELLAFAVGVIIVFTLAIIF